jgi:DNA-binding response OmpR family regulator
MRASDTRVSVKGQINLQGFAVMIVEDEFLLAIMLEQDLLDVGASIVGPFTNLEAARAAAANVLFDVAVLDVNLDGEMVYPLADDLVEMGRPFVFLTGYSQSQLPTRFQDRPHLAKPYDSAKLMARLSGLVRTA